MISFTHNKLYLVEIGIFLASTETGRANSRKRERERGQEAAKLTIEKTPFRLALGNSRAHEYIHELVDFQKGFFSFNRDTLPHWDST